MKVFVCVVLLVVAVQASIIPNRDHARLRDSSKIQERWSEIGSDHDVPKSRPATILRTPTRNMRVEGCGIANPRSQGKVVSGVEATPHQYPWAVALEISGGSFCTGSLISDQWVMTAAHCAVGARFIDVTLGAHNRDVSEEGRVTVRATELFPHENYGSTLLKNDIALVKLPEPITFTDNIRPICLPSASISDLVGETVAIAGWGKTKDGVFAGISPTLQTANVTVITNEECTDTYGIIITDSIMCTSVSPSGTCNGDSGSALNYYEESSGLWTQVGVTSFVSSSGCESGLPDGFTRVSSFLDWIASHTGLY